MQQKKWLSGIACVLVLAIVGVFFFKKGNNNNNIDFQVKKQLEQNKREGAAYLKMLKTGDLLLRTGNDEISRMFRQLNASDKTYSHSGIVLIENGYPFVYHSIGGVDNPDERLRRDSAIVFIAPEHNLGFGIVRYDFNELQIKALSAIVAGYYKLKPLFDMDFDLSTDDKLYCSEFVYKAISAATQDSLYLPVTIKGKNKFVGVDNLFNNKHAQTICQLKYK